MKVCTASQMRNIDKSATELGGIPSIVLMENAAMACVEEILKQKCETVSIFCGKGNNGGDGFAIARHLFNKGINVSVFLVCGSEFSGDALINFEIISKLGIKITELDDTDYLNLEIKNADVIVDAIFGTGITGEICGIAKDVIKLINENSKYTISVDIPSGINADTGEICSVCINADKTVTFAAYKKGLLLFPGADFTGEIVTKDISIPEYIIDNENININIIDKPFVKSIIPKRHNNSHKGDYGKILIVGTSVGLTGAAVMAAESAMRCGAGLVSVAVPKFLNPILETKLTEAMTIPLPDNERGFSKDSASMLCKIINNFDACLFGPGIGRDEDIVYILSELLKVSKIPVIIDADGLFALSQNPSMLEDCSCNLILTPHEVEMARLIKSDTQYVCKDRLGTSLSYATQNSVCLILKGHHTVVTSPEGVQYININGNNGMATGGSGDVLGGMIAAFSARGLSETEASAIGVYMHALSADIAIKTLCCDSLIATDIINNISNALNLPVE